MTLLSMLLVAQAASGFVPAAQPPRTKVAESVPPAGAAPSGSRASEVTGIPGMTPAPGVPSLLESGVPPVAPELTARVAQYQNARAAGLADVSDDGAQILITTRFGSTNQLHLVEQPMGARTQLTFTDEPVGPGRFVAGDPQTLYYLQDKGGGKFFQVLRLDRRTGRSEVVTDGKSRHGSLVVSRDGVRLAWSGTGRNGKDTDVYVATSSAPKSAKRVTSAEGTWAPVEFSPDGTQLLIAHDKSISDVDLHLLDVASGELRQVTPREGKASVREARFAADGKSLFIVTDRYSDYNQLYQLDLSKPGAASASLSGPRWDVEDLAVSSSGEDSRERPRHPGVITRRPVHRFLPADYFTTDTRRGTLPADQPDRRTGSISAMCGTVSAARPTMTTWSRRASTGRSPSNSQPASVAAITAAIGREIIATSWRGAVSFA